jgi:hypothetical protein
MSWIKNSVSKSLKSSLIKKNQKHFLWLMGVVFLILGLFQCFESIRFLFAMVFMVSVIILSFYVPKYAKWPLFVWTFLGLILSEISSTLVLSLIFFLIITPIGWVKGRALDKKGWQTPKKSIFDKEY